MGCGKDLTEDLKVLVIKEIAKVETNKSIVAKINHCVVTELSENVRILGKISLRFRHHAFSRPFHAQIFVPRCQRKYFNHTFDRSHYYGMTACGLYSI